jgi:hypothetical protein
MKRNRYNRIDFPDTVPRLDPHESTENRAEIAPASVLEALNRIGHRPAILVGGAGVFRLLEKRRAPFAKGCTIGALVAPSAAPGRKHLEDAIEERTHERNIGRCRATLPPDRSA